VSDARQDGPPQAQDLRPPDGGWQPGGPHPADPPRVDVRVHARMTTEPLSTEEVLAFVADAEAGGTGLFLGTVRDHNEGVGVTGLVYETWPERADAILRRVATEVAESHATVRAVAVEHRTGPLAVGDAAIVAAASAPHRGPAIAAVAELVERVKAEVPIWKQEQLAEGGHRWPGIDTDT
jgi:molybdopterin synthase catalytic subunit